MLLDELDPSCCTHSWSFGGQSRFALKTDLLRGSCFFIQIDAVIMEYFLSGTLTQLEKSCFWSKGVSIATEPPMLSACNPLDHIVF